jgi:hypothetical protein
MIYLALTSVVPANAGTHTAECIDKAEWLTPSNIPRPVVMGPRFRGDDGASRDDAWRKP